jgi:hypothetical protein
VGGDFYFHIELTSPLPQGGIGGSQAFSVKAREVEVGGAIVFVGGIKRFKKL